ncbi:MAG: transketolase [Prevotellaceae bacterium]|jgi:transketolase|nr:transketolase [Prevotellaceae bacterium]
MKYNIDQLKKMAHAVRLLILKIAYIAGKNGSHVGGGLSVVEILTVLYGTILKYDLSDPTSKDRDRLILSKGHAANALFAILAETGFIERDELSEFEQNGSHYYAHASRNIHKGIEFSGGSLSLGLSFAVGVALSNKIDKLNNHVYVIVGDGECDEGLIWEALMSAANFNLTNLTVIVDCNGIQLDGLTSEVMNQLSLADKFSSFGFHTQEVDGHDIESLYNGFISRDFSKPNAIIAHTVKGKGISFMENNRNWHHGVLSQDLYESALNELNNGGNK